MVRVCFLAALLVRVAMRCDARAERKWSVLVILAVLEERKLEFTHISYYTIMTNTGP